MLLFDLLHVSLSGWCDGVFDRKVLVGFLAPKLFVAEQGAKRLSHDIVTCLNANVVDRIRGGANALLRSSSKNAISILISGNALHVTQCATTLDIGNHSVRIECNNTCR